MDLPKALGRLPDYSAIKDFIEEKLVNHTVSVEQFQEHARFAVEKWPAAASYLNTWLNRAHQWAAPYRMQLPTLGYKADSPVESSFSATKKAIGDSPQSFVGVVQTTVRRDEEQTKQEQQRYIKQCVLDFKVPQRQSDAANACGRVYSDFATDRFQEQARTGCMDYTAVQQDPTTYHVSRKQSAAEHRVVSLDPTLGRYVCSCLEDRNMLLPCRHILCVTKGEFDPRYFGNHWLRLTEVVLVPAEEPVIAAASMQNDLAPVEDSISLEVGPVHDATNSTQTVLPRQGRKRKMTTADFYNTLLDHCKELCKQ